MLYTFIQEKYYPASVKLSDEEADNAALEESPLLHSQSKLAPIDMEGWAILLMWIPAVCDLTGTTVSNRFTSFGPLCYI